MNAIAIGSALHPSLRDDWARPAVPEGFDRLVYCEYGFAGELDFLNDAADVFASEEQGHLALPSPWVDGFVPALRDWQALDILFIDLRPR